MQEERKKNIEEMKMMGDEAAKEDEIVKGTEGEKREGRSVEEKNRKDDRSEG